MVFAALSPQQTARILPEELVSPCVFGFALETFTVVAVTREGGLEIYGRDTDFVRESMPQATGKILFSWRRKHNMSKHASAAKTKYISALLCLAHVGVVAHSPILPSTKAEHPVASAA